MNMDINRYNKYHIKETDRFIPDYFMKAEDELRVLVEASRDCPGPFTDLLMIAYLKNHSLDNEWVEANPRFSAMLTENRFCTDHLQSLFISSKGNPSFTRELEDHIREQIASQAVDDKERIF